MRFPQLVKMVMHRIRIGVMRDEELLEFREGKVIRKDSFWKILE